VSGFHGESPLESPANETKRLSQHGASIHGPALKGGEGPAAKHLFHRRESAFDPWLNVVRTYAPAGQTKR
jgi:hypothetical protein